jgi:hypothetical protein
MITEHQYRRLMKTYNETGVVSHAAMKAGMDRETATRYLKAQAGPDGTPQHSDSHRTAPSETPGGGGAHAHRTPNGRA